MRLLRAVSLVALAAFAGAALPSCSRPARPHYDVVITGGTIYDGSGSPGLRADVGIVGDCGSVLADMLEMEPSDDRFDAKLSVLKEEVRHHARDEEEGKLFKEVRRMLDKDQLAALGNELLAMFEKLMEQEPRMEVPSQTGEAADLESAAAAL